jgi:hypothetical protein
LEGLYGLIVHGDEIRFKLCDHLRSVAIDTPHAVHLCATFIRIFLVDTNGIESKEQYADLTF